MSESRKGNGMRYGRSVVIWASLVLTIVALVMYVVMVFAHQANPVWNRALLTYCGVFWVFFAFDEVGRRAAIIGEQKRAAAPGPRPRPQPNSSMPLPSADNIRSGPNFAASGEVISEQVLPEVGLQRIQQEMLPEAQAMVNDCLTEVLALSGTVPQPGPSGRVPGFDVEAWLGDDGIFPFVITSGGAPAGVTALRQNESSYELVLLYVKQGLRRQRIGQQAFTKLEEFSRLLGIRQTMTAHVSSFNMRGQRFYRSVGMIATEQQGQGMSAADPQGQGMIASKQQGQGVSAAEHQGQGMPATEHQGQDGPEHHGPRGTGDASRDSQGEYQIQLRKDILRAK